MSDTIIINTTPSQESAIINTNGGVLNDSIRASVQVLRDAGWTVRLGSLTING